MSFKSSLPQAYKTCPAALDQVNKIFYVVSPQDAAGQKRYVLLRLRWNKDSCSFIRTIAGRYHQTQEAAIAELKQIAQRNGLLTQEGVIHKSM